MVKIEHKHFSTFLDKIKIIEARNEINFSVDDSDTYEKI